VSIPSDRPREKALLSLALSTFQVSADPSASYAAMVAITVPTDVVSGMAKDWSLITGGLLTALEEDGTAEELLLTEELEDTASEEELFAELDDTASEEELLTDARAGTALDEESAFAELDDTAPEEERSCAELDDMPEEE